MGVRYAIAATYLLLTTTIPVFASEPFRQSEAHVHGEAELNVVISENMALLELRSPAVNIIGFEDSPQSDAEWQQVKQAEEALRDSSAVVEFSDAASCVLVKADVHSSFEAEQQAAHNHDEEHAEFEATYTFECSVIDKLESAKLVLFETFPGVSEIRAQVVLPGGQTSSELTADEPNLYF